MQYIPKVLQEPLKSKAWILNVWQHKAIIGMLFSLYILFPSRIYWLPRLTIYISKVLFSFLNITHIPQMSLLLTYNVCIDHHTYIFPYCWFATCIYNYTNIITCIMLYVYIYVHIVTLIIHVYIQKCLFLLMEQFHDLKN